MHDITPLPSFLRSVQSDNWTVRGALSELIDNSFGLGRGDAGKVWIIYDKTSKEIMILDDGRGMEAIHKLFQLGAGVGRIRGDIGHYGAGGTKAIIWLPSKVSICTFRDGKVSNYAMSWSKQIAASNFFKVPDKWDDPTEKNVPWQLRQCGHGTFIQMKLLQGRTFHLEPLIADMVRDYAPGLRSGKEIIWTTMKKGAAETSINLGDRIPQISHIVDQAVRFDVELDILGSPLPVKGEIALNHDTPVSQSVIAIGFGYRVIERTRSCFTSPDGKRSFHGTGISGWVDMGEGWQAYLTTTKDGFNDDIVRSVLMGFLYQKILPLLERTEKVGHQMAFRDLGISLTAALNSGESIRSGVDESEPPVEGEDVGEMTDEDLDHDEEEPEADQEVSEPKEESDDGDGNDEKPAVANVQIEPMTDSEMEGILCTIDVDGSFRVRALVNGDHGAVKSALATKPANHQVLSLLVVHGLAAAMMDNLDLLKRTFPRPSDRKLIDRFDGRSKEQFIVRCLMDRVISAGMV